MLSPSRGPRKWPEKGMVRAANSNFSHGARVHAVPFPGAWKMARKMHGQSSKLLCDHARGSKTQNYTTTMMAERRQPVQHCTRAKQVSSHNSLTSPWFPPTQHPHGLKRHHFHHWSNHILLLLHCRPPLLSH